MAILFFGQKPEMCILILDLNLNQRDFFTCHATDLYQLPVM